MLYIFFCFFIVNTKTYLPCNLCKNLLYKLQILIIYKFLHNLLMMLYIALFIFYINFYNIKIMKTFEKSSMLTVYLDLIIILYQLYVSISIMKDITSTLVQNDICFFASRIARNDAFTQVKSWNVRNHRINPNRMNRP